MAVAALLERIELVHKLALPIERRTGVAQRKKPQLVGPHAAREAVEQARLQDLLDVHEDLGGRRLRVRPRMSRNCKCRKRSRAQACAKDKGLPGNSSGLISIWNGLSQNIQWTRRGVKPNLRLASMTACPKKLHTPKASPTGSAIPTETRHHAIQDPR